MTTNDIRPLAGVRVLELGNYIAAPTAGRMLADFGAEVIKVERPVTGDELRNWRLYSGDDVDAVPDDKPQQEVNRCRPARPNKAGRSSSTSSGIAMSFWRTSGPAPWRSGGWDPTTSMQVNQELVITRISAFGQTGPMSQPPRLRGRRRGVRRPARTGRRSRPAAGAHRRIHRRLHSRDLRGIRHRDGAVSARARDASPASVTAGHRCGAQRSCVVGDGVAGSGLSRATA